MVHYHLLGFGISHWAEKTPDKTAFIYSEQSITYSQLEDKSCRLAAALQKMGIHRSDSILIYIPNCTLFPVIFYAAAKLQANIVVANPQFKKTEIEQLIPATRPKLAFVSYQSDKALVRDVDSSIKIVEIFYAGSVFHQMLSEETPMKQIPQDHENPTVTICTSGSTGRIKFVVRTFENQLIPAYHIIRNLRAGENDVAFVPLPLSQQYGLIAMIINFAFGGTMLVPSKFNAEQALVMIEKHKVTIQFGVPTMYIKEINAYEQMSKKPDISSLRTGMISGAPAGVRCLEWFEENAGCRLLNSYGTTEIAAVTMTDLDDLQEIRYNTCGKAFEAVKLKIINENGVALPAGETGQILCKTPYFMREYAGELELTHAAFDEEHWFLTEDIGSLDENGNLSISGRKKDIIIRCGNNIFPSEIEVMLLTHQSVSEACVIGNKDPVYGERTIALIKLKRGSHESEESLRAYAKTAIAKYKVPDRFIFIDEIPKLQNGKTNYLALKTIVASGK